MSSTLGEKLRQAREARGITISEVAEQTRISPLYIESIEKDDYSPLPGGIFNKGFVKSFAKYVGVDEQEALQDYLSLSASQNNQMSDDPKTYRPEVLTDDRSSMSNLPTIIFAIVILGLMTWGILALVNYIQQSPAQTAANTAGNANANTAPAGNVALVSPSATPLTNSLKVEFSAVGGDIYLSSVSDGKSNNNLIKKGNKLSFEPTEKLNISFARERVKFAEMTLNGKQIALPAPPAKGRIILEINKENAGRILESGQISLVAPTEPKR